MSALSQEGGTMAESTVGTPGSSSGPQFAGFKVRAQAGLVDEILLGLISTILVIETTRRLATPDPSLTVALLLLAAILPARILFRAAFVATTGQTPGKRWMGIMVHGPDARIPSVPRAIGRAIAVEALVLLRGVFIGWGDPVLIHVRDDRRAGHDFLAGTRVVHLPDVTRDPSWLIIGVLAIPWMLASAISVPVIPLRQNSDTMRPTIRTGDQMLVTRWEPSGDLASAAVGNVVVFVPRDEELADRLFVKRIVAAGGDTVRVQDGALIRNGEQVEEPYILEPVDYAWPPPEGRLREGLEVTEDGAVVVPEGHYFVLGDHRNDSNDSHRWGRMVDDEWVAHPFLPAENVRGRVLAIIWPPDRAGVVE